MFESENTIPAAEEMTGAEGDGWDDLDELDGAFSEEDPEPGAVPDGQGTEAEAGASDGQEAEETDKPSEPEDAAPREQEKPSEKEPEYPVVYKGQRVQLPLSQLTSLAQKGMNYDTVYEQASAARQLLEQQAPAVELVEQMAAINGLTLEQYLAQSQAMLEQGFVAQQTGRGVPEQTAREMWADRIRIAELSRSERQRAAAAQGRQAEAEAEHARRAEFEAFIREYPEVQRLPDEVIAIKQQTGESITSAYRKWELGQLKAQMAAQQAELQNRRRAPQSAAGVGKKEETDPFLAGWDNAY